MCGIVACRVDGAAAPASTVAPLRRRLLAATESLAHRGPDGDGIWLNKTQTVGLGHRRLAVHGGSDATQPLFNEDGSIVAVVNGEFYDPNDRLRRQLLQRGHRFGSDGDSELAVHLYEEYGLDFVNYLRGEFAIVLHDSARDRTLAIRDRFGIKPLVFTTRPNEVWFASQIRALRAAGLHFESDEESVWHAFQFQYTLPDRTVIKNVRQVPPGHFVVIQGDRLSVNKYWDCDYQRQGDLSAPYSEQQSVAPFYEQLKTAVHLRLRGDVPVVTHLSGGIDSASVLALAAQHDGVAAAFTVSFTGGKQYDELSLASSVAERHQVPLHAVRVSPTDLIAALPDALQFSEGWAVNGHLPAKFLLNQAIHQAGYKVALTGEGADELLAGYAHLRIDWSRARGHDLSTSILASNPASAGIMLASGPGLSLTAVARRLGYVPAFLEAKASLGHLLSAHLRRDFLQVYQGRDAYDELLAAIAPQDQLADRHPVHQSLYLWNKTALSQYILRTLGDGCESTYSVEGRLPMLDHVLFEWVKGLPLNCLLCDCGNDSIPIDKWLLRNAMQHHLPTSIIERPKHPFVAPPLADEVFQPGPVQDAIQAAIDVHPYFDPSLVRRTIDQMRSATQQARVATDPLWWTLLSSAGKIARCGSQSAPDQSPLLTARPAQEGWWKSFYDDAAMLFLGSKDETLIRSEVDFMIEQLSISAGDRLLDQCCGLGQYACEFAVRGLRVMGFDQAGQYINSARQRANALQLDVEFKVADALNYVHFPLVDAVINWHSSFGYLAADDDNLKMLRNAFLSLRPGGQMLLDFPNMRYLRDHFRETIISQLPGDVELVRHCRWELSDQTLRQHWQYTWPNGDTRSHHSQLRTYQPLQIEQLLMQAGFATVELLSSNGSPLQDQHPRCVALAIKRTAS